MQGRLVPPEEEERFWLFPRNRWRDEFSLAADAGLDAIEWIFDVYGEDENPLATDVGVSEIRALSEQTGVAVRSLCANYFIELPILRTTDGERSDRIQKFLWLLSRCAAAGIRRIVVPFLDRSRINNDVERLEVARILHTLLPAASAYGIELHLETSLPPQQFAALLEDASHPLVRVTYDSGNSASLGYVVRDEFAAYGHRIGSVHIKDRLRNGGTVPLGNGNADFQMLFNSLAGLNYSGDFVLEIARQNEGNEVHWLAQNRAWLASQLSK
jgi:hexulose-6-phosphate isomerase